MEATEDAPTSFLVQYLLEGVCLQLYQKYKKVQQEKTPSVPWLNLCKVVARSLVSLRGKNIHDWATAFLF